MSLLSSTDRVRYDAGTHPDQKGIAHAEDCELASGGPCGCVACRDCGTAHHYTGDIDPCPWCGEWVCADCRRVDEVSQERVCPDCLDDARAERRAEREPIVFHPTPHDLIRAARDEE